MPKKSFDKVFKEAELGLLDGPLALIVTHGSGEEETIHLTLPITFTMGKVFNILQDAQGYEHYFTPEGLYDGWGRAMSSAG